ncbi:MAG: FKBP-type peptidyl-prolyl cis-trans isomerase [Candidatus Dormibacteria bacterium]
MFEGRVFTPARVVTAFCLVAVAAGLSACGIIVPVTAVTPSPTARACATPGPTNRQDSFKEPVTLVSLQNGLQYGDVTTGCGMLIQKGTEVQAQFTGWLQNGTEFDSSRLPQREPLVFTVGSGEVIPGLEQGMIGMHVGGKRRIVMPPSLAYGSQGFAPVIPPNATLIVDVEVVNAR